MRKLLMTAFMLIATIGLVISGPVYTATACCNCKEIKSACRAYADTEFANCQRDGGGWLVCYMYSEDKYQLCVSEASNGQCSIFHD